MYTEKGGLNSPPKCRKNGASLNVVTTYPNLIEDGMKVGAYTECLNYLFVIYSIDIKHRYSDRGEYEIKKMQERVWASMLVDVCIKWSEYLEALSSVFPQHKAQYKEQKQRLHTIILRTDWRYLQER